MGDACAWLPPLILLSDHYGDWNDYVEVIYAHFKADFIDYTPKFAAKPCWILRQPISDGKEPTFWHITSEGEVEAERTPDLRRCERVRWPRPLIEEETPGIRVLSWRVKRGKKWRINVAPLDFSYLVVLAEMNKSVLLVTAFWVEREHRRKKLRAEWELGKV